jgi:ligand-binding SRPBCC domain-containing protein
LEIHFEIKTLIKNRDYLEVFNQFDEHLFNHLTKGQPIKLVQFDGSKLHDEIHLEFPFHKKWISIITEKKITDSEAYFIDEGTTLPFGLKKWKHKHIVRKANAGCEIIDSIYFTGKNTVISLFLSLPLFLPILLRKMQYKSFFEK